MSDELMYLIVGLAAGAAIIETIHEITKGWRR
jgi:hypothetical protein